HGIGGGPGHLYAAPPGRHDKRRRRRSRLGPGFGHGAHAARFSGRTALVSLCLSPAWPLSDLGSGDAARVGGDGGVRRPGGGAVEVVAPHPAQLALQDSAPFVARNARKSIAHLHLAHSAPPAQFLPLSTGLHAHTGGPMLLRRLTAGLALAVAALTVSAVPAHA